MSLLNSFANNGGEADLYITSILLHVIPLALVLISYACLKRMVYISRRWDAANGLSWTSFHYNSYRKLVKGFRKSIEVVSSAVRNQDDVEGDQLASNRLPLLEPQSGTYECVMRSYRISDKKTNELWHGWENAVKCTISLQLSFNTKARGWNIRGNRRTQGSFHVIEEGFVALNGKCYWVERSGNYGVLVNGHLSGTSFHGEWYSSSGDRGPYEHFHLRQEAEATATTGTTAATPLDVAVGIPLGSEIQSSKTSSSNDMQLLSAVV